MAKWLVSTPNTHYNGVTEGVQFENGQAVVEDDVKMLVLVNDYGYSAEEIPSDEEPKEAKPKKITKKK